MTPVLSKIVLGTMRMDPGRQSVEHWVQLVSHAHSLGVARLHCSDEYESFHFLRRVLETARRSRPEISFEFVVKIAEPHFGEADFDAGRLQARIDAYRAALGVDRLDCVQWLWRGDLKDELGRLRGFSAAAERLAMAMSRVKAAGAVRAFYCFPYTVPFAAAAIEHPMIDGLAIYRNPLELEYEPLISRIGELGKNALVIRPFKAGAALDARRAADLIAFSARMAVLDGVVVSCSSMTHLTECVEAAARC
jgi:aryl-alcohol dehydrogenase-like predicted oxidoreductase